MECHTTNEAHETIRLSTLSFPSGPPNTQRKAGNNWLSVDVAMEAGRRDGVAAFRHGQWLMT